MISTSARIVLDGSFHAFLFVSRLSGSGRLFSICASAMRLRIPADENFGPAPPGRGSVRQSTKYPNTTPSSLAKCARASALPVSSHS